MGLPVIVSSGRPTVPAGKMFAPAAIRHLLPPCGAVASTCHCCRYRVSQRRSKHVSCMRLPLPATPVEFLLYVDTRDARTAAAAGFDSAASAPTRVLVGTDPGPFQCCKAPGRLLEPPERGGSVSGGSVLRGGPASKKCYENKCFPLFPGKHAASQK